MIEDIKIAPLEDIEFKYVAFDGTKFDNHEDALDYVRSLELSEYSQGEISDKKSYNWFLLVVFIIAFVLGYLVSLL
jgi:hypothetical protein